MGAEELFESLRATGFPESTHFVGTGLHGHPEHTFLHSPTSCSLYSTGSCIVVSPPNDGLHALSTSAWYSLPGKALLSCTVVVGLPKRTGWSHGCLESSPPHGVCRRSRMAMTSMPLANHQTLPNWHKSEGSLYPATPATPAMHGLCTSVGIGSIILCTRLRSKPVLKMPKPMYK